MRVRTLQMELWLPQPIGEVFAFFGDAHNLEELTPSWLRFHLLTPPPIPMARGDADRVPHSLARPADALVD